MSWLSAMKEAEQRMKKLPIPKEGSLAGLTVTLMDFETDSVAGGLVGGQSAMFQTMVNRAMTKLLKKRGAMVDVVVIKLDRAIKWRSK